MEGKGRSAKGKSQTRKRRTRKPWYRAWDDCWYTKIGGKPVKLAEGKGNEDAAWQAMYRVLASAGVATPPKQRTVAELVAAFHARNRAEVAPSTARFYADYLKSFKARYGRVKITDIRPLHVSQWLDGQKGWKSPASRRAGLTAVKTMFAWAVKPMKWLAENPLADMERPPAIARQVVLTPEQFQRIIAATKDREFRDFLTALLETGARPREVAGLQASDLHLGGPAPTAELGRHKTWGWTGKPRVIHLTPRMVALCRELAAKWPGGPIFRNTQMNAWTRNSIRCRFRTLRGPLGLPKGGGAYSARHVFCDDALAAEIPIKTVATLLGHTDTRMVDQHYSRLTERKAYMQAALARFRPDESTSREPSEPTEPSDD